MTVTEILGNFRLGLISIVPAVEQVGIPWKRPDAYDEWDSLAMEIYKSLVVEPIRWRLAPENRELLNLFEYDMLAEDYSDKSVICTYPHVPTEELKVFHAFGTKQKPFDTIEYRRVMSNGLIVSKAIEEMPFDSSRFVLKLQVKGTLSSDIVDFEESV